MYKLFASFTLVLLVACAPGGDNPFPGPLPNVYQPANPSDCEELEYRWRSPEGVSSNAYYPGVGNFCTYLDGLDKENPTSLRVRCVIRADSGEVSPDGDWIEAKLAPDPEEFKQTCFTSSGLRE